MELETFIESTPYDGQVNSLLRDYQLCEKFHVLPEEGGLNNQNPFWLECMEIIIEEIAAYSSELASRH